MNRLLEQHRNRRSGANRDGFTLIEMVVVIAVIALLAAIVTPLAISVIKDARIAKAQGDAASLAKAIQRYRIDTGVYPFVNGATSTAAVFGTLSSPGASPTASGTGWATPPELSTAPACAGSATTVAADDLELFSDHFLINGPGFATPSNPKKKGWKGTYVSEVDEDPFGNKYLSNIGNADDGCSNLAVYVLSAGPDGVVDTAYSLASTGIAANDDILARVK